MSDYESHLTRWQSAGVLDPDQAARIRAFEAERKQPAGLQWQVLVALILGAILLFAGVALFVNAHWDQLSALSRYVTVRVNNLCYSVSPSGGTSASNRSHW